MFHIQVFLTLHSAPSFSSFASNYYSLYVVDLNFCFFALEISGFYTANGVWVNKHLKRNRKVKMSKSQSIRNVGGWGAPQSECI